MLAKQPLKRVKADDDDDDDNDNDHDRVDRPETCWTDMDTHYYFYYLE